VNAPNVEAGQRSVRGVGQSSTTPLGMVSSFILEGPEEPKTSEPVDELKEVSLGKEPDRTIRVSSKL